jgi:hypothetical protein
MYNEKQRKKVTKMIEQARKDIWKMEKKIDKIKLWLDVYETLVYGDIEVVQDEEETTEETTEEILKKIEEDPEEY